VSVLCSKFVTQRNILEHNYLHLKVVFSVFFFSTYQCTMKKINFYKTRLVFKFQWFMKNMSTFEHKKIKTALCRKQNRAYASCLKNAGCLNI